MWMALVDTCEKVKVKIDAQEAHSWRTLILQRVTTLDAPASSLRSSASRLHTFCALFHHILLTMSPTQQPGLLLPLHFHPPLPPAPPITPR